MIELTLDGPGRNCLGTSMMTWLDGALEQAAGQPVLLQGANQTFSAGLDLKEVATLDVDGMGRFLRRLEALIMRLYHYPGPTVALVEGHAIAGGCVLARCCDVAVATPNPRTRIGLNEIALGLRFPPRVLGAMVGRIDVRHRSEVLLGAGLHTPSEACRLGLVDLVSEDAPSLARSILASRAAHPAEAYAAAKHDLYAHTTEVTPEQDAAFATEVLPTWTSDALKQRILAALKR
jgi:enoyl-CoA hydratase/carnithine racemase